MDNRQTAFLAKLDYPAGQILIADTAPQLPVQGVHRDLAKRIVVDVLDGAAELLAVEEGSLDIVGVALEPFVGPEPSPGRASELAADRLLLLGDQLDCLADKAVMVRQTLD